VVHCVVYSRQEAQRDVTRLGRGRLVDKYAQIYPKTGGLSGSLQPEWKRCGKAACRCMQGGPPHGPYWTRRWRSGGLTRKAYVRKEDLDQVRAAIALWHLSRPSVRSLLRELRELAGIVEGWTDGR
jgi:hypothetical protein